MKLQVQKTILEAAVANSSPYTDKKDLTSITSHIYIGAKDGVLTIKATDNEIGLAYNINTANISDEGEATANGKKFLDIIKSLKDAEVVLETVETSLFIRQKGSKYKLPMQVASEFPTFPTTENRPKLNLNAGLLAKSLKKISTNIENMSSKVELTGSLIDIHEDHINIVGTDTKRLSVYKLATSAGTQPLSFIIPKKAISEITKLFFNEVEIFYDENIFIAKGENFEFYTKLINGRYPDYARVIPNETKTSLILNRDQIAEGIKTISMLCEIVKITIQNDKIIFKSMSEDNSEAITELPANFSVNEPITFGIKNRFFLDFIASIEENEFEFGHNGDGLPICFSSGELKTIVMPVSL